MNEIKEFIEKRLEFEKEILDKAGFFDDDWDAYKLGMHHGAYLTLKVILKKLDSATQDRYLDIVKLFWRTAEKMYKKDVVAKMREEFISEINSMLEVMQRDLIEKRKK